MLTMLPLLLALTLAGPCDSAAVPVQADAAQRPGVVLLATSSATSARWYVADTVAGRCLGYIGTSTAGGARSFVGFVPAVSYTRSADTATTTREAAVRLLLARTGALRGTDSTPAVIVMRDTVAGATLVSSGVPLPPGRLYPGQAGLVHVSVGGFEQAIATRELAGRHPDGSLRAVLVQLRYVLTPGQTLPAVLRVGGAPRAVAQTRALAETAPLPAAVLLPTDPDYLVATRLGGDLRPASEPAATPLLAKFAADYVTGEADDWKRGGALWNGYGRTAGYDRGYTLWQQWARTGDPLYAEHALAVVENYVRLYAAPAAGFVPWYAESRSVAVAYWLTGHEPYRAIVHKIAANLAWAQRPGLVYFVGLIPNKGDDRARARLLDALMDAKMLDADAPGTTADAVTMFTPFMTARTLDSVVTLVLKTQAPNGQFGGLDYLGGTKPYMQGMLMAALVRYHDDVNPADERIQPAMERAAAYLWKTEWNADSLGFRYVTKPVDAQNQPVVQPSLNALVLPAFAWLYTRTRNPAYAAMVDAQLAGQYTARAWFLNNGKSFDETYTLLFNVAAWRWSLAVAQTLPATP